MTGTTAVDARRLASARVLGSFDGTDAPDWILGRIREGLGGVVLFAQNVQDTQQLAELCATLRSARADIVIAIDEEGGDVTRLHASMGTDMPAPAAFGVVDDVALTRSAFGVLGNRLAEADIDLTLAPCADVNSNPRNPIVGVRAFGAEPERTGRHVAAAIRGIHDGGALSCVKHFPGHGDTVADTHHGPARVEGSMAELAARELPPFVAAIAAGVDAIMTAHLVAPALDDAPASLSAPWMRYLRDELGFEGVIITDALDMGAVAGDRGAAGVADAAVAALAAGADLLCLGASFTDATTEPSVAAIADAITSGRLDIDALERSTERASDLHRRRRVDPAPDVEAGTTAMATVAAAAVVVGGPTPRGPFRVVECRPPANLPSSNVAWGVARHLGASGMPVHLVDERAARASIAGAPLDLGGSMPDLPLAVVVRDSDVHPWQADLVRRLSVDHTVAVVVELGWPGLERPDVPTFVVTHGAARSSTLAVAALLAEPRRKDN